MDSSGSKEHRMRTVLRNVCAWALQLLHYGCSRNFTQFIEFFRAVRRGQCPVFAGPASSESPIHAVDRVNQRAMRLRPQRFGLDPDKNA